MTTHVGEDMEKEEHSSFPDGTANWYKHSGNQSGGSSVHGFYVKMLPLLPTCKFTNAIYGFSF